MAINEWSVSLLTGWSVSIGMSMFFLGLVLFFKFKGYKGFKYLVISTLTGFALSLIVQFISPTTRHMYYQFEDYDSVESLVGEGWELVTEYENKNIVHMKKKEY